MNLESKRNSIMDNIELQSIKMVKELDKILAAKDKIKEINKKIFELNFSKSNVEHDIIREQRNNNKED